jgi:hypothetical protein
VETLGTARLADEIPAERAVAAVVPRDQIAVALQDPEAQPELRLEVARKSDGGDELDTIGITWSRETLEQLLERATGDSVVLTFDRAELAEAFADVEAHGIRERALVFAVVAAGALGSGAAIANAMPILDPGSGGPSAPITAVAPDAVSDAASGGGYTAPAGATDSMVTDASSGGGYVAPGTSPSDRLLTDASSAGGYTAPAGGAAADSIVTDASSAGGYTAPAGGAAADSIVTDASSAGGYTAPAGGAAADSIVTDASSAGGYTAPAGGAAADSMVTDASSGGGYTGANQASVTDSMRTDASTGGYATDVSGGSAGIADRGPQARVLTGDSNRNLTDELLAGGVLLAIAGATFTARRRPAPPRPA